MITMNEVASQTGVLYLCATPIGNMEDMTYRAVRIMREADIIAAEDTRRTRKLLTHFDIHTPLISYHEHNKREQGEYLLEKLRQGQMVVCVSDAGMPVIADPGAELAQAAIKSGLTVSALPGANAALTALVCSGLSAESFRFVGFLPKTAAKRKALLAKLAVDEATLIFYEAPHHLRTTLAELYAAMGNRVAVTARELTKKFEEFKREDLATLAEFYAANEPRGEFVIIVAGADEQATAAVQDAEPPDVTQCYKDFLSAGLTRKDALRETAKKFNIGRREVYNIVSIAKDL